MGGSFSEEIGCRKRDRHSGTRGEVFDTLERASSTKRNAADRLGQSAFDLFGSPIRTVFLSDPVR